MVTKADLDAAHWQEVVAGCERKEVGTFTDALINRAIAEEEAGNESLHGAYRFLAQLCSMRLVDDDAGEVFRPTVVLAGGRSLSVGDLTAEDLALLEGLLPAAREPELAARIGDVLWVAGRRHQAARIAVVAYLESARNLEDPDHWLAAAERLKRAVHLAAALGKGGSALVGAAVAVVEAVLDRYQGGDTSFLSAELMELLQDCGRGDPARYATFAEAAALRAMAEPNFIKARAYWKVKARWHGIAKEFDQEAASRRSYAQTYVVEADRELAKTEPSFIRAATHLRAAIESYRRIPGGKADADRLRERLDEYQGRGMAELKPIETGFDPTPMIAEAEKEVEGRPFQEALFRLATMGSSPSVRWLKENAKKLVSQAPFHHMTALVMVDRHGRPIRHRLSIDPSNPDESGEGMRGEILRDAEMARTIHVVGTIEPARRKILYEHSIRDSDLLPILYASPFVPPGREGIFGRGLAAGLRGDYLVAAHLLIPQLENSIREALRSSGAQTTSLDNEGIQQEKALSQLSEEMKATFGEDLAFDLEGLLFDEFGANLRNRFAHGLLAQSDFSADPVSYMWWLTLRLCCLPILATLKDRRKDATPDKGNTAEEPSANPDSDEG
jgi:hypothetical protein